MLNRLLTILLLLFFVIGGYVAFTAVTLPNVRTALQNGIEPTQTSQILARDKTVLMAYGKFQHKPITMADMPPTLIDALISTEDRRFYTHKGVDPVGVARALVTNVKSQGVHEGGSTITQQLARNIFLSNERSIQRKVKEALLALKLEQQLDKDQILELYLNNVYFGEGAYGVGAASRIYFGKPAKSLSVSEAALLAGMPQAPSAYSPFSNLSLAMKRRDEVLDNMVENNKLTEEEAEQYKKQRLHLNPSGRAFSNSDKAPFFSRYVINQAQSILDMDEQTFWQQGLRVYTTVDPRAQDIAQTQVRNLSNAFGRTGRKQQASLLSLNSNGEIIAYVGGKDFQVSQFDRVSQAKRLAGSLFKVFVYTTALEQGFSPVTVYRDAPVQYGDWEPRNYDKGHHGYMTLARALSQSNNVIAAKLVHDLTPAAVIQTARKMGVRSDMPENLALSLGATDVTLKEMTSAFSVLANNGFYVEPFAIEKIVDKEGRILYQHSPSKRMVLQRAPRDTMVAMMQGVVHFGTGRGANIGRAVAGKTGTSDDYRDAWFIGFTPEVTTGVWVGNDDNSPMPGITGGSLPARIWRSYMSRHLAGMPKREFDLAYATPIEEKDFFVYDLANLSASEGEVPAEELQPENAEAPVDGEPPEAYLVDPETGEPLPQPLTNIETEPSSNGPVIILPDPAQPPPPPPVVPPPTSGEGRDRFFETKPTPNVERFSPSPSRPTPTHQNGVAPISRPVPVKPAAQGWSEATMAPGSSR